MVLDLVLLAILILYTAIGHYRGFVVSVIKTFGWIISIWLASKWTAGLCVYVKLLTSVSSPFTQKAIAFAAGLIITKLAYMAIVLLFSKRHHDGDIIGKTDALFGAVFGLASGALLVMVVVMLIPAAADVLKMPELSDQLAASNGALYIFQNNPLLHIVAELKDIEALKALDFSALKALGADKLKELVLPAVTELIK